MMYASILVPLDGSPLGERALAQAVPIAEQHGAKLILMHVVEPINPLLLGGGVPVRDSALDLTWRDDARKYLEKAVARTRKRTTVPVEGAFKEGKVVPTIAAYATEAGVGLIVMCTHGRGGFERFWLGSVADGLIRHLPVPVLLVRAARKSAKADANAAPFARIVVALDGSARAERALSETINLVQSTPTALTLVNVVHPTAALASHSFPSRAEQEMCANYLEPLAERNRSTSCEIGVETLAYANVGRAILEVAKRHDATMIALATQGLGGAQRMIVGSVADKLIRTATVPVLVVPPHVHDA
jgi:nucleotide-binding universal stress UspA family protein